MSSSFITNKDKFLSDIINGILPKTDAVDILVGYFIMLDFIFIIARTRYNQYTKVWFHKGSFLL